MWWFISLAAAQSTDWVPAGTFASPWDPPSVGGAELFLMSGGGAEWLVVRQQGRTLEGSAAFVAVAGAPQASAPVLARVACATVTPPTVGKEPWTGPSARIADELEAFAALPHSTDRELRFWVSADEDLVELVIARSTGALTEQRSGAEILRLRREADARYERSLGGARHAATVERAGFAMRALDESGDARTNGDLADLARSHPLAGGRVIALELLHGRRGNAITEIVVAASVDPAPEVRIAAVKLLARMGTGARPALEHASEDPDPRVREAARLVLTRR